MKDTGERLIPKLHSKSIAYGEHLARYYAINNIVKNKVVLDIACGTGYGSAIIAKSAKTVYGVDVSEEAIKYAKNNYSMNNIEYIHGDAIKIPLKENSVDVVVSLETIEHIDEPEKFIKEVKRVLKKDGQFIVSTPNDDEFTDGNIYHVHEFDYKELNRLMKKYFNNYEYYFQGSWFTSGILNKRNFEEDSSNLTIDVKKSFNQKFNKAIYYIAVASDSRVEVISENLIIADVYSAKIEQDNSVRLQSHIGALNTRIDSLEKQTNELNHEIYNIYNSKSWRLIKSFRRFSKGN